MHPSAAPPHPTPQLSFPPPTSCCPYPSLSLLTPPASHQSASGEKTGNSAKYRNYLWKLPSSPVMAATPLYVSRTFPNGTANTKLVMVRGRGSCSLGYFIYIADDG